MDEILIKILIGFAICYFALAFLWWAICASSSKNAIRHHKRGYFDVVEIMDLGLSRFWRWFSRILIVSGTIWGFCLGFWWLILIAIVLWFKVMFYGSIFYWIFNRIESHYGAKVSFIFGLSNRIERGKEKQKQIEEMKKKGWTVPDSMK